MGEWKGFIILVFLVWRVRCVDYYSTYYGVMLSSDEVDAYNTNGTLANCTNVVAPCDETEPRRINGTCNNLDHPSRGATRTPYYRVLPATFNRTSDSVFDPRVSVCSGGSLPGARDLRRSLLIDGRVEYTKFTQSVTHFSVFFATDIVSTQDTRNYLVWRTHCCNPEGAKDPQCAPISVPTDDYVHQFTGITCFNMTRPLSFQTSGCLPDNTTPDRIIDATPNFDLSPIYGSVEEAARRTYTNGMLRTETIDDVVFPPSSGVNVALGDSFFGLILFWRYHNHIAQKLVEVNPCWTDQQIFETARDINIACANQIMYYEMMPKLMGTQNLIDDGVIMDLANDAGFRDIYNATVLPEVSVEYPAVLRWMHKMLNGVMKFYDSEGNYLNESFHVVNVISNITYLKQKGRMAYITEGSVRQACGKIDDNAVDPDLLNKGVGNYERSSDILTNDLTRTRYYGIPSYTHYRAHCFGDSITSFEQLRGIIADEDIQALKDKYSCVGDIDLLVGIWLEILLGGAHVPPTFYCIVKEQLLHNIVSDRFWYERDSRPNAFTKEQMSEIRHVTASRMICDVGDSVTKIQQSAFELPGEGNEINSCSEILDLDYTAWRDDSCST